MQEFNGEIRIRPLKKGNVTILMSDCLKFSGKTDGS